MLTHASRQLLVWLIFDVRQNMKTLIVIFALGLFSSVACWADELDRHARATTMTLPSYPVEEKKDGVKGLATVVFRVDATGVATVERVMGSSHRFIDALATVAKTWKFSSGMRDGKRFTDVLEFIVTFDPKTGVEVLGPIFRE